MEDPDDDRMYMVVVNHGAVFDLACRKSASCGLEVGRKDRHETGVPSVHRGGVDRYAPVEPETEDESRQSVIRRCPIAALVRHGRA